MEKVQIFQDKKVRTHWEAEKEEWYFSVVDVVGVLTDSMVAVVTTTAISHSRQPESFAESRSIAIEGGNVAGSARREIEQRTGQPVVSPLNATDKLALDTNIEYVKQIEPNDI